MDVILAVTATISLEMVFLEVLVVHQEVVVEEEEVVVVAQEIPHYRFAQGPGVVLQEYGRVFQWVVVAVEVQVAFLVQTILLQCLVQHLVI
jgi:hypothetical protein